MFRIALATIIGLSSSAQAADWPNWRGPRHDGISRETDWTSDWMASEPKELWGVGVGTGFSSLAISDGRAFTAGHNDGQDTVFCLNAETGKLKWKHSYPAPLVDNLHEGGPAATPTVDEGRVYTLSKDGQLFAFDAAKGEVLWQAHIGELADVVMPEWGFSCSALVVGDMLILDAGSTIALDKHNGKLVWKTERYRPGYGSATPCTFDGQSCVAVLNNDALILVRTSDGAVLASHPWQTNYATTSTTPIVQGDDIFISSGYQRGCALLRRNDEKFDVVYENRNMSNHMATCVLHEGHLYGIDGNSHNARTCKLVCLDWTTGDKKWSHRGLGCGSLMIADGKLLVLSDDGELVVAEATPREFREIARTRALDGRCWTVPVLANGRIYCRSAIGDVVCLDVRPSTMPPPATP